MEQANETVSGCGGTQNVHGHHVVVSGNVGLFENRSEFELARSNFIVTGLYRYAKSQETVFNVLHEGQYASWDSTEIVVFKLLTLRRRSAHNGAASQHKVRTKSSKALVYEEVFLFNTSVGTYKSRRGVTEEAKDTKSLVRKSRNRAAKWDLAVKSFARIGVEEARDIQGCGERSTGDEYRNGWVPSGVTTSFKGGTDATRWEGRSVWFAADEHFTRKLANDVTVAFWA